MTQISITKKHSQTYGKTTPIRLTGLFFQSVDTHSKTILLYQINAAHPLRFILTANKNV